MVSVADREEKGSDVNVATHLLIDIYEQRIDAAIVVSNDSYLALPVHHARTTYPGRDRPPRHELSSRRAQRQSCRRCWGTLVAAAATNGLHQPPASGPSGKHRSSPPREPGPSGRGMNRGRRTNLQVKWLLRLKGSCCDKSPGRALSADENHPVEVEGSCAASAPGPQPVRIGRFRRYLMRHDAAWQARCSCRSPALSG
jgi:hypothetical protein